MPSFSIIFKELLIFFKNPIYKEDENTNNTYRLNIIFQILGIALMISVILGAIIGGIESIFKLDFGKHAIDEALDEYPIWFLGFAVVVLAPLIEETIFRGPMFFFEKKPYFKYVFYGLTLIFGFYHITNFEISTTIIALSPLLVAPQLSVGALMGFIRVRFGLIWAMLLHALYNLILIGPVLVMQLLDLPLE